MENEYVLSNDDFLVSETDKKGVITFANDDFCRITNYKLEELIGKPHNIIRYKDMPRTAFKDLWDTITANNTWTGYVKNQIKDGGFYWVFAMIYPMENGYLSCCRKPSVSEIKEAEELYKTMK